jgi:phosphoenolpyruvate carboxylase
MSLLWNPESWSQRLAELEAQSGDLKEAPLRRDEFDVAPRLRKAYS